MVDIKQIRRSNMLTLIKREKTKAAFARKVGTDPAYISQILSVKTKAEVGSDLARGIEAAYKLPHGWMDREHGQEDRLVPDDLSTAWDYLLPDERAELEADIKRRAAHNKAVGEMLAAKPVTEAKPPPKRPATAVTAGPPSAHAKKTVRRTGT